MTHDIDRIVSRFAAPAVPGVSEGARELMHEIIAGDPAPAPVRPRRRLSPRVAVPAGALLAAGAVGATWLLPMSAAAALDITEENGYYVIEIKDLYANPKIYEKQLRDYGLDLTLTVVPSTAAFEGQVFPTTPDNRYLTEIQGIYPPGPCDKLDGCAIGVKIPTNFKGTADVAVGRKARPGEKYQSSTTFSAKGEPMHCVPYRDKPVAEVRELLKDRGVRVSTYAVRDPAAEEGVGVRTSVPDTWYVDGGFLTEPGVATLVAKEKPLSREKLEKFNEKSAKVDGCPVS
ncbi:hypothetical protein [Nonomuraea sp. NPDC050643]|uniref:hypothetical protein n=1 Tax=Nonomuraea sp. NPDC050643 TaxID=3155660 RepID=UPI0033F6CDAB